MGIAVAPARITVQRVTALSVFPEHALYIVSVYGSLRLIITKPAHPVVKTTSFEAQTRMETGLWFILLLSF